MPKTILLVLENRTYRDALFQALGQSGHFGRIVCVGSALEALHKQQEIRADLVLLGLSKDGGIPAVRALRMVAPDVAIVALGISDADPEALDWAEAGTLAFVPETASLPDLLGALDLAAHGESQHSASCTASLIRRLRTVGRMAPVDRGFDASHVTRARDRGPDRSGVFQQGHRSAAGYRGRYGEEPRLQHSGETPCAAGRNEAAAMVAGRVV